VEFKFLKIETYIPIEYLNVLREELNRTGALSIDSSYDYVMAVSKVTGSWRPLEGSSPFEGETGKLCEAEECKVEFCCRAELMEKAVGAIKKVHPYEVPVINVIPTLNDLILKMKGR